MSAISFASAGYVCQPQGAGSVTVVVQEQITGSIVADPLLAGSISDDDNLSGYIVEDCEVPAIEITSFALVVPAAIEIGTIFATPGFTASYSRTPTAADVTNDETAESLDVVSSPLTFASADSYQRNTPGSTTWTMQADDGGAPDTRQVAKSWQARLITGWTTLTGPYTEAQILALSEFANGLDSNGLFQVTPSPSTAYLVAAYHDSFNGAVASDFKIGNFLPGGAQEIQTGLSMAIPGGTASFSVARSNLQVNAPGGINWQRLT